MDIASRRTPEYIKRRLPSMYHQFMELAGVDITAEAMEVGPTCHYMMGGVRVDAETQAATVPGLFAIGEASGGMHGANRLGGNSLSDLIVFGRRAGIGAADFAEGRTGAPHIDEAEIASVIDDAFAPFGREDGYNPYDVQHELQETMQTLVGIIRTGPELEEALAKLEDLKQQTAKVQVKGGRAYNPGWNLATDLPSMITTSIAVAQGALNRKESRGGHTREDYPGPDPEMGKVNIVQHQTGDRGIWLRSTSPPSRCPRCRPNCASSSRKDTEPWLTRLRIDRSGGRRLTGRGPPRRPVGPALRRGRGERREGHDAGVAGRRRAAASSPITRCRRSRARWCSTSSTGSRPSRRPTWRAAGTARPASAARARPRSTACRGSCA